jgi:uncharacterized protein (DUF1330 family)
MAYMTVAAVFFNIKEFVLAYGMVCTYIIKGELTMTVYVIADIEVTDDTWIAEYAQKVHDIVHRHGGKYLSRSANIEVLEGEPLANTLIALLEFPSAEAVTAFVTDPEYAPFGSARKAGSNSRFQMIDDTDVAGTIAYLGKG